MVNVLFYRRKNDARCSEVETILESLQAEIPHQVTQIYIDEDESLAARMGDKVPVLEVGPYHLVKDFVREDIFVALSADRDRREHLEKVKDETYRKKLQRGHSLTGADRFAYWMSRNYMWLFNILVLVYVGLPFAAPALMKLDRPGAANVIYSIYSPLCHQLGYRSFFLFGEQAYYPRELAGITGLKTFEAVSGIDPADVVPAGDFLGNSELGYKVALCERDVAIYGGIFLFGIVFMLSGRRIKSIPWQLWVLLGIVPIGLDGASQMPSLLSQLASTLPWLPMRESTPFLRVLTGGLFGVLTAWYGYPYVEETFRDTRLFMEKKLAVIAQGNAK